MLGFEKIFGKLGLSAGKHFLAGAEHQDMLRVKNMDKKTGETTKLQRKKLRAIRKAFLDKERDNEGGDSYSAGIH